MHMQDRDLKIFIGPTEIANIGAILANALGERGIRVTVVTWKVRPLMAGMKYDLVLDYPGLGPFRRRLTYLYHVLKFIAQHNAFIFLFGNSLLPYNLDLPILKLLGKKTVMWFLGDDIRHHESLEAAAKKASLKYYISLDQGAGQRALKRKMRMIHMVEKYADHIISYPSFSQLLTREYETVRLPLDIRNIRYNSVPNPRPIVVHAPSDDKVKGTSYIIQAVERLKNEGHEFDFNLFRNTSNIKVRGTLSEADIAVDQLFATHGGMFALEAMAAGCAVLGGNIPEFSGHQPELPIMHTDPDNIYHNLKLILGNPELRRELGEKGRRYVEKYHDSSRIASNIIELLTSNKGEK
jgi:hypothetical protein